MSILLSAHRIKKTFGARPLFDNLTFAIESGERIGLIGPNGAGKSTLMRIIAGQHTVDEGTVSFQKGLRVGFLEQVPEFKPGATVFASIIEGTKDPDDWECMALAQECMSRLHLDDGEAEVSRLSGGWKKRVALARELARQPDLLLLDEPTNHLDVESILWLETFLARAQFATLTITHDRVFLQRVSNRIIELDKRNAGGLLSVQGDYAAYLEVKQNLIAGQESRELVLKNTLRRETEWLRRGAKARTTKQQARITRHGELSEEVAELSYRNKVRTAQIDFSSAEKSPKKLIEAKRIRKSYGGRTLFTEQDFAIRAGTRIGLLGANGCGKSTLIRVLLGQEQPDSGTVTRSESLSVAYFEQNRETLDPTRTVLRTLCPTGDQVYYQDRPIHIRGYLDRFLFSPEQMDMAVGKLSGGEQSRLLIAKLMLNNANLLVLDEPTNDLDMATLGLLEEALNEFPGAVLLVTHDRYFMDQVANQIIAFPADGSGELVTFEGLEQWEAWHAAQGDGSGQAKREGSLPTGAPAAATSGKKAKKLSYKDQRELDSMEETIHKAEAKLAELTERSADPSIASNAMELGKITEALGKAQAEVDRLYARWAELDPSEG